MSEGEAAIEMLDDVLRQLEAQRAEALPVLRVAKGVEAEAVFKAVAQLDDKIAETRAKRAACVERLERAQRMGAISAAVKALRAEFEAGVTDPLRLEELRRRRDALLSEAEALRTQTQRDSRSRGSSGPK